MLSAKDDLQGRWWKLEETFLNKFGKKPDVEAILFLIGIQEIRNIKKENRVFINAVLLLYLPLCYQ